MKGTKLNKKVFSFDLKFDFQKRSTQKGRNQRYFKLKNRKNLLLKLILIELYQVF